MVRKKNLKIRNERFFLAAKAIKQSIIRNSSIEEGGSNCPILVEGINDVKCLRIIGFSGIIETINKGWDSRWSNDHCSACPWYHEKPCYQNWCINAGWHSGDKNTDEIQH